MGVVIRKVDRMDGYHDRNYATVEHNGHVLDAVLVGPIEALLLLLHENITAEYELNEIISVDANLPQDDTVSGIYPMPDGRVAIDGTVHNETVIDERFSVFDVYIQKGADFLSFCSEELNQHPSLDTRIRIVGKGLHVYPTFM